MSEREKLLEIASSLRKVLPSYATVPFDEKDKEEMVKANVTAAFCIMSGEHAGSVFVLREVKMLDGGQISIDYSAFDKDKKPTSGAGIEEIIGNIVNYSLAMEALKELEASAEE
jgi:hypothetical protein